MVVSAVMNRKESGNECYNLGGRSGKECLPTGGSQCALARGGTARLTRSQLERWFGNRKVDRVIMEACGSAHHGGRWLNALGIEVKLLPAAYVRAYVKRNKTDAADACALLEAARLARS
jgi:transposase